MCVRSRSLTVYLTEPIVVSASSQPVEGGVVEDIRVSNIVMSNIKQEAVVLNLKYSQMPAEAKSERTPIFRNVHISGMTVTDVKTPIKIVGLEEAPIFDIVLRDIHIQEPDRSVSLKIVNVSLWIT